MSISQFIHFVLNPLCPLCMGLRFVGESLPRNWISESDREMFADILVHLIHKIEHGKIEFQLMFLAETCYVIEFVRVVTREVNWDDIPFVFNTFSHEGLLPWKVADCSVILFS